MSSKKYYTDKETDQVMLEDDSGRIRLVGDALANVPLVTGCIVAVMGTENASGEFEVLDIKFPDLAPQVDRWALSAAKTNGKATKDEDASMSGTTGGITNKQIAIVSGLAFSGTDASYALELNLLLEYLLGESLGPPAQADVSHISRLIIAGNSISTTTAATAADDAAQDDKKKYGYDASAYNPLPSQLFDEFVSELLPSMPVTLLPGAEDPANASYPQQPIHTAMFPRSRVYGPEPGAGKQPGWFDAVTNPFEAEIEGWRVLGTGGQNVDDIFKYVDSEDRLGMMEAMCRWRCCAPTAPDTLCKLKRFCEASVSGANANVGSYPFQEDDPFVMKTTPHLYFVGCQPRFGTKLIGGPEGQTVRLVAVPSFSESKEIVLVDTETLEVRTVKIQVA